MNGFAGLISSLALWGGAKLFNFVLKPWDKPRVDGVTAVTAPFCASHPNGEPVQVLPRGGPDDGAGLFDDDEIPCMSCGNKIRIDWDGNAIWHLCAGPLGVPVWCVGSRKPTWELLW